MVKGVFYFQFGILLRGVGVGSPCLRSGFAQRDGQLAKLRIPFCRGIPTRAMPFQHGNLKYCARGVTFFVYVKYCLYFCIFKKMYSGLNISVLIFEK